ncbi:YjcG family protein [Lederbergia citrea]|uniref:Putative phosphoesterase KHA91_01155 n=1 Tax=Lederbergia citrea TaxID=2833581 RepID=A0A942UM92_9BACI|nr:YjcG family protein [Lederbergia citrea]MBS4177374.1 YjcG family protein [Lederbergia citrea]MBS4204052.1 YjcG family protein [Lederbergia citrea]MBS4221363.1 YjcG family protein [Lederbergia citrea]
MKYGIVIFPSKKLQDLANSYRKRYDPHYALIPPHLTLRDAFESDEPAEQITEKLDEIAKKYEPFNLTIRKVSSFQPINNTIHFKAELTDELRGLHQDLYDQLPGGEPEHPFVPHVTIAQKLSNDEHSDVYGSLRMLGVDHEELIDRFHLVYQLENGSWSAYETFRLGKDPQ